MSERRKILLEAHARETETAQREFSSAYKLQMAGISGEAKIAGVKGDAALKRAQQLMKEIKAAR
jgi:hypothetical protein